MKQLKPIHPGKIILKEYLKPLNISQYKLAKDISVPLSRINQIILKKRSISVDTAYRLSIYFNTTPEFWLNLQSLYDLNCLKQNQITAIKKEVLVCKKLSLQP
jgi:addiction module HigA family antidote